MIKIIITAIMACQTRLDFSERRKWGGGGKAHDTHDTTLSIAIAPIKKAMSSNFDTVTGGYQPFESDENPKMKVNHC